MQMKPTPTSAPLSYPLGLACTPIRARKHVTAVRILDFFLTPSDTAETITFLVYHQPFLKPHLSFRDVRHRGARDVRYIYAVEVVPYDPALATLPTRQDRQLRTLIQQEASRISGFTLKETRPSWPISQQGTILATPLAPAR